MPDIANNSILPVNLKGKTRINEPKERGDNQFYSRGLNFSCTRCSACCRHESGYVFLSEKDLSALLVNQNMGRKEFIKKYCRWIPAPEPGKEQLSLKEKRNLDCTFWKDGCTVYDSRPLQCRSFPFWEWVLSSKNNWKQMASECPGIDKGTLHSRDSIENWLVLRQKEPIIERSSAFIF